MVQRTQNSKDKNKTVKLTIEKLFESEKNSKFIDNMIRLLNEDPMAGTLPDPMAGTLPDPMAGTNTPNTGGGNSGGGNSGGGNSGGGNSGGGNGNSTVGQTNDKVAGTNAGFPPCAVNIPGGKLNSNNQWVATVNNVVWTLTKDFKYTNSSGESGTWACNADNTQLIPTPTTQGAGNTGGGDWTQGFPECVKSFKKLDSSQLFQTVGKDSQGIDVDIYFFKTPRQGGQFLAVSRPVGVSGDAQNVNLLYNCNNGLKITDMYGQPYTVGAAGQNSGQPNLTPEQNNSYTEANDWNKYLGIKIFNTNYKLNTVDLESASEVVISYMSEKYRSASFGYYAKLLNSLVSFYTSMGNNYSNDLTFVKGQLSDIKDEASGARNSQPAEAGQPIWNSMTNPVQSSMDAYTPTTYTLEPFTVQFKLYRLTGQLMNTSALGNVDDQLKKYLGNNTIGEEFCRTTMDQMLSMIQYQDRGFLKRRAKTVTSNESFSSGNLQAIKQVIANCARQGILRDKNEISALSDEGLDPKFKVKFSSTKSTDQPKG
jgi:hypothetical protein